MEPEKISDAQTEDFPQENLSRVKGEDIGNHEKRSLKIELALIFILGFLLGMVVKTEALKRITMGFNDYLIVSRESDFDYSAIEKRLSEAALNNQTETGATPAESGTSNQR